MSEVFIRQSSRTLRCLASRRGLQKMLDGVIITCDDLAADAAGEMNHERRFKIERERAADVAHNDKHLGVVWILEAKRRDFTFGNANLVVGHESAGAHHAK